jgi:acyl carrier protein
MNFSDLLIVVNRVFPDESNIEIHTTKRDLISWDSIGHLNLILEVEDEYGISFLKEEIESIDTIQKLYDVIIAKTAE